MSETLQTGNRSVHVPTVLAGIRETRQAIDALVTSSGDSVPTSMLEPLVVRLDELLSLLDAGT